ncbi:Serine/threonine-protein kinase PrkC [invertebrate metagenome]|uniref:Serine/threonine-protein kinase PrkC n=1 Tax=invertebrate metagenome TaxID=1711999 RepID=A0A2H9T667_9ZZZZ
MGIRSWLGIAPKAKYDVTADDKSSEVKGVRAGKKFFSKIVQKINPKKSSSTRNEKSETECVNSPPIKNRKAKKTKPCVKSHKKITPFKAIDGAKGEFGQVGMVSKGNKLYAAKVPLEAGEDDGFENAVLKKRELDQVEVMKNVKPHQNIVAMDFDDDLMEYAGAPVSGLMEEVTIHRAETKKKTEIGGNKVNPYDDMSEDLHEESRDSNIEKANPSQSQQAPSAQQNPVVLIQSIGKQTTEGICHLHDQGVIHFDIKPDNLLINNKGEVKIADFGRVQKFQEGETLTKGSGEMKYMPPECVIKGWERNEKADIWPIGILIFELSGNKPFVYETNVVYEAFGVRNAIGLTPPIDMSFIQHHIEQKIAALCTDLAKENPARFSSRDILFLRDFLQKTLLVDYPSRPDAEELLRHPFLNKFSDDQMADIEEIRLRVENESEQPLMDVDEEWERIDQKHQH